MLKGVTSDVTVVPVCVSYEKLMDGNFDGELMVLTVVIYLLLLNDWLTNDCFSPSGTEQNTRNLSDVNIDHCKDGVWLLWTHKSELWSTSVFKSKFEHSLQKICVANGPSLYCVPLLDHGLSIKSKI